MCMYAAADGRCSGREDEQKKKKRTALQPAVAVHVEVYLDAFLHSFEVRAGEHTGSILGVVVEQLSVSDSGSHLVYVQVPL